MKYSWLDEYCLKKKGVVKDFKAEWNAHRFMIAEKMFLMLGGDKEKKPIITVKCEPEYGLQLREKYKDIIPGYYMNKLHWNSIYIDGKVPDDVVKKMIDMSYNLILSSLSKKLQDDINNHK